MKQLWWVALNWNGYQPKCRCGWIGLTTFTYKMAARSATIHERKRHN